MGVLVPQESSHEVTANEAASPGDHDEPLLIHLVSLSVSSSYLAGFAQSTPAVDLEPATVVGSAHPSKKTARIVATAGMARIIVYLFPAGLPQLVDARAAVPRQSA
jgi:hypothetical protein